LVVEDVSVVILGWGLSGVVGVCVLRTRTASGEEVEPVHGDVRVWMACWWFCGLLVGWWWWLLLQGRDMKGE